MRIATCSALLAGMLLGACASVPSGQSYPQQQTGRAQDVTYGEVVDVRVVKVDGHSTAIGTWGGAAIGRAVGVTAGGSWETRTIAGAAGGVAGAIAGEAVERKLREDEALEITVRLDNAGEIAIVQADDVTFATGDRVRVLLGRDGSARVTAL